VFIFKLVGWVERSETQQKKEKSWVLFRLLRNANPNNPTYIV
jgi:hypothetical protein